MKIILVGQFFREVIEQTNPPAVRGWTVVQIESDEHGLARTAVVRNDTRTSAPRWISYGKLEKLVEAGEWLPVSSPSKPIVVLEPEPAKSARGNLAAEQRRRKRNANILGVQSTRMKILQPLIALGRDQFFEHIRRPLIKKIAKSHRLTEMCVWQYLCLYWQFGMKPEGVRPRHCLAGQKSISRRIQLHDEDCGKHPFRAYKTGPRPSPEADAGIEMHLRDIELCRKGALRFLFRASPDHRLHYKWDHAHTKTLNLYYDRANDPNHPAPTCRQFKTAVKSDPKYRENSRKIVGELPYARNDRQLKNSSRIDVMGPGALGAVDDVTTKVILIDEVSGLPLGTGRVFVVVDVWSKIIAGAHDTLQGSSYSETMEGLFNAFQDKATFAAEHDLKLNLKYLPCSGVFKAIEADNGPLGTSLADSLPESICDIVNTTSYRPDLKSDVETSFHAYLKQHAENLPGYNRTKRTRGDDDPQYLAYLTPKEFRILLWKWIEVYNQRPLAGMLPVEAMRAKEPPDPTPYELWPWGVTHCGGHLTYRTDDELRLALLARDEGTATKRRGVNFRGLIYLIDEKAQKEVEAYYKSQSASVVVLFDHKYVRQVFIELKETCIVAKLRGDLDEDFGHLSFPEIAVNKARLDRRRRAVKRNHKASTGELAALTDVTGRKSKANALGHFTSARQRKAAMKALSIEFIRKKAVRREQDDRRARAEKLFNDTEKASVSTPHVTPAVEPVVAAPSRRSVIDLVSE